MNLVLIFLFVFFLFAVLYWISIILKEERKNKVVGNKNNAKIPSKQLKTAQRLLILGLVCGLIAYAGYQDISDREKALTEPDYQGGENLKTTDDVNKFIRAHTAVDCQLWHDACNHVNSQERWNKQLYINDLIETFYLTTINSVIRSNDLPDSYLQPAKDEYLKEMKECSWSDNRSDWPGRNQ